MGTTTVTTSLAAPIATAATNISTSGFTANWETVNNASSYNVIVYDATHTQVGTTINVPAGTLTLDVTSLNANASYTYTVSAKGDAASHFDSTPSASIEVSTTITALSRLNDNLFVSSIGKTIITSETGAIQIYNLQGTMLMQVQNTNKVNTNLVGGLYVVRFTNNAGKQFVQKVIIK